MPRPSPLPKLLLVHLPSHQAEAFQQEASTSFEKLSAKGKEGVLYLEEGWKLIYFGVCVCICRVAGIQSEKG